MTIKPKHKTRESWLVGGMAALDKAFFKGNGYELPAVRASVGWPRSKSGNAIGQCWDSKSSADETHEMFICPTQAEPTRVLDILLHEMIHACVGIKEGHKGLFRKLALEFGLEGKMTATVVTPGTPLHLRLCAIAEKLGPYPHAAMLKKVDGRTKTGIRKQLNLRSVTPGLEEYRVTVLTRFIEEFGYPKDPVGVEMEAVR